MPLTSDQQHLIVELLEQFLEGAEDVKEAMAKDASTFTDVEEYVETIGLHDYKVGLARQTITELQLEEGRHRG
jgi:DNA polymerase elongation subunit (family B)